MSVPDRASRPYDIVVFGATGFTGGLVAEYLAKQYQLTNQPTDQSTSQSTKQANKQANKQSNKQSTNQSLQWAIAGRNRTTLQSVADRVTNQSTSQPNIIQASSTDYPSLLNLTAQTRCVITTVGPFAKYGESLIKACIDNQCDYVDITGETAWVRLMHDKYHSKAVEAGILMLPLSGFDSLPSLMSFWYATNTLCAKGDDLQVGKVTTYVTTKGALSGGTAATMMMMFEQFFHRSNDQVDPRDPWILASDAFKQLQRRAGVKGDDAFYPIYDQNLEIVTMPALMGTINSRAVRGSMSDYTDHANEHVDDVKSQARARRFVSCEYRERMILGKTLMKSIVMSTLMSIVIILFFILAVIPFTRPLLSRVLPAPGDGPNEQKRKNMFYQYDTIAEAANQHIGVKVQQVGPEAYESTALYCVEVAALLSDQKARDQYLKRASGFTSANRFMARELMERVQARGIKFQVIRH